LCFPASGKSIPVLANRGSELGSLCLDSGSVTRTRSAQIHVPIEPQRASAARLGRASRRCFSNSCGGALNARVLPTSFGIFELRPTSWWDDTSREAELHEIGGLKHSRGGDLVLAFLPLLCSLSALSHQMKLSHALRHALLSRAFGCAGLANPSFRAIGSG